MLPAFTDRVTFVKKLCPEDRYRGNPLGDKLLIDQLFDRAAIDLVGPIAPAGNKGHKSILTLVDYATRNRELVPLKNIDTETVIETLLENGYVLLGRSSRRGIE